MIRIVCLGLGAVIAAAVQVPSALSTRLTGPDTGVRPLVIRIPIPNQTVFEEQLIDAAHSAKVPIGLERIREEPLGIGERPPPLRRTEIPAVGQPLGAVLDVLVSNAPARQKAAPPDGQTFVWRESNRVIHITPFGVRATFLDTVIPVFEMRNRSAMAAMNAVHQSFDSNRSDYPEWQTRTGIQSTDESRNAKVYAILERPITVSLKNASARDILDAIILANGEVSWIVEYGSSTAEYRGSWISLRTFNGGGRGLGAQIR